MAIRGQIEQPELCAGLGTIKQEDRRMPQFRPPLPITQPEIYRPVLPTQGSFTENQAPSTNEYLQGSMRIDSKLLPKRSARQAHYWTDD